MTNTRVSWGRAPKSPLRTPSNLCAFTIALVLVGALGALPLAADDWAGIGPEGGTVVALATVDARPEIVWAAIADGGVFRSTDGGATWSPARGELEALVIHSLAADPVDPARAWAGTSEGLWTTTDSGATWRRTSLLAGSIQQSIAIHRVAVPRTAPEVVYASALFGLWKSTDAGATWAKVAGGLPERQVTALAVHPDDPRVVYAGSINHSLWWSTDGGATWSLRETGLARADGFVNVRALALAPSDPSILYASVEQPVETGLYRSTDGGATWQMVAGARLDGSPGPRQPVTELAVDPAAADRLLAGGEFGLFRSDDGGEIWQPTALPAGPLGERPTPAAAWLPSASGVALAGTAAGGVFRSSDAGLAWSAANQGLTARPVGLLPFVQVDGTGHAHPGLVVDPRANGRLYALSRDFRLYGSDDWGTSWERLDPHFGPGALVVDLRLLPTQPDVLFATVRNRPTATEPALERLFRSTDAGATWQAVGAGLPRVGIPPHPVHGPLHWDPENPGVLVLRLGDAIYPSTDLGLTFSRSLDGLPSVGGIVVPLDQIAPAPGGQTLFAWLDAPGPDTCTGLGCPEPPLVRHLFRSTDGGATWQELDAVPSGGSFREAEFVDPDDASVLYTVREGDLQRSTDGGASFAFYLRTPDEPLGSRPEDGWPAESLVDPRRDGVRYEVRFGWPVRRSDDGGETWYGFSSGLAPQRSSGLVLVPFTAEGPRTLLAATPSGIWARGPGDAAFPPPAGEPLASEAFPDFRFWVRIEDSEGDALPTRKESTCLPEALCVSGAVPGRVEVVARIVGPKPNGFLWPTLVKLTTSKVRVWVEQISTGVTRSYILSGTEPGFDELLGLFDRNGFEPGAAPPAPATGATVATATEPPPAGAWLTTPELPGFRSKVRIGDGEGAEPRTGVREPGCLAETLCVSGAVPGRTEVLVRVVGPKPNGFLWPTLVKLTTSAVDVWIERVTPEGTPSEEIQHYVLPGAEPGFDLLPGLFDRTGFVASPPPLE